MWLLYSVPKFCGYGLRFIIPGKAVLDFHLSLKPLQNLIIICSLCYNIHFLGGACNFVIKFAVFFLLGLDKLFSNGSSCPADSQTVTVLFGPNVRKQSIDRYCSSENLLFKCVELSVVCCLYHCCIYFTV